MFLEMFKYFFLFRFNKMSCDFNLLKDMDDIRETLKIGVRIIDMWMVENCDNNVHLEMVVMDKEV